jgi:uncharacterized protein
MNNNLPRNRSQTSRAGAQCRITILQRTLAVRYAMHWILIASTLAAAPSAFGAGASSTPSLRETAGELLIGVGLHDRIPERPMDWPLLLSQFSSVTPENSMKPDPVQRVEGQFRFDLPDAFVDFATSNELQVVGHCLVWAKDDRTPPWFYRDGTNVASADLLLARMKTHIDTVVGRYRGRIAMWDVVNEALDDGPDYLRDSGWSRACGEEFIMKAFEYAHAADPQALLIYNDYNNELPDKRAKLIRLVRSMQERNVPLHAVGLQGHYEIDRIPFADIEATLIAMRELGVKVVVSELDIDVIPRGRWWQDGGKYRDELARLNPYADGCPPEILERQADQYGQLFRLFRQYPDVILRVSFWNLHDGQSWLNDFPWSRVNHPLLFDRQGQPKPAFHSVIEALRENTWPGSPTVSSTRVRWLDATRVRLLPGSPFHDRQELHRTDYLAALEPDRLLFHYRALAGMPQPKGVRHGLAGWDSGFIRGHMAGHYLSAASRMAAATGDATFRERVDYVVAELAKCQEALKQDGYLAAFSTEAFDWLEGKPGDNGGVVVPYYTIHKIMAGLVDAHHYLGNTQGLDVALKMADYFDRRLAALSEAQVERMFRTDRSRNPQNEFGAMSDVLAELYAVTGDRKHLDLARLFNRPWFIEPLANGEDRLAGLHGNTHIAQAVGMAHCANLTGNEAEQKASENFWRIVTGQHSFVIGGNSFNEWFGAPGVETGPSIHDRQRLPATTAESCNTHNMLKLTTRLFEREPGAEYADYYERALYNHLLATVAPETGAMSYFLPLRGHFRTYLDGTHCCVGSGIENPPRYNEGIYFQRDNSLWVNLYIPSELDWQETGLILRQEGDMTRGEPIHFTVVKGGGQTVTLNLRIPHWISQPAVLTLNGQPIEVDGKPSTYVSLRREWEQGDVLVLTLPAALRLEQAQDDSSMISVFWGPLLLAGELGRENMPDDFADKDAHLKLPPAVVPGIVSASAHPAEWLQPIEGARLAFRAHDAGPATGITFGPLFEVHHQRYSVYWTFLENRAGNE